MNQTLCVLARFSPK